MWISQGSKGVCSSSRELEGWYTRLFECGLEKRQFLQDSRVINAEDDPASVSEECNCKKDLGRKAWDGNSGFLSSRTKEKWEK